MITDESIYSITSKITTTSIDPNTKTDVPDGAPGNARRTCWTRSGRWIRRRQSSRPCGTPACSKCRVLYARTAQEPRE